MSNFLTIATVTETLRQMLDTTVGNDVPGANATAVKPSESGEKAANIYLYQVSPNASWRNDDLPSRRGDRTLINRPRAALDLYYLFTFYGDEAHQEPQRIMGSVISTLHSRPVLSRQQIREAISHADFLNGSDLGEEIELVRFTPISLSLEELNNLWSGFFQIPYSLSMAYQASVVFIEGKDIAETPLPVLDRNLYVATMRQPHIEEVASDQGPGQPILANSRVIVRGRNLSGDATKVLISGKEIEPDDIQENRIGLNLPEGLRAGMQSLQVIHEMMMGTPLEIHRGSESNVSAFVLRPTIKLSSDSKTISVNPEIGKGQRVVLLLNEINRTTNDPPAAYTIVIPIDSATSIAQIPESEIKIKSGEYLVRLGVDGANSPLVAGEVLCIPEGGG
jgi:hypothetical protein